jgi:hypothetical protein
VRRGHLGSGRDNGGLDEAAWHGGVTPATESRCYGTRGHRQAAPAASSPSCAAPGLLLDGGAATAAKNGSSGGALGFWRLGQGCTGRLEFLVPRFKGSGGLK